MATFRGQDGTVFATGIGGTLAETDEVAEMVSWSLTLPREKLDISVMGDASKKYRLGMKDWSGTIRCRLEYGDATQKTLVDEALVNDPSAFTFRFAIGSTGTATTPRTKAFTPQKYFQGAGYIELSNIGAEISSIDDIEFNIIPAGDLTITWA